jgi:hypothetical protein
MVEMKALDQWPLWIRAVFWNVCALIGIYLGFMSSGVKVTLNARIHVAVFTVAFFNLAFLVLRPRVVAERAAGKIKSSLYGILTERPYVTVLVILQLLGTSRSTATTILLMQLSNSAYVRSLPNGQSLTLRLIGSSFLMAVVALLWLLSAIGIWQTRTWGWWLALVLNGLAATVSAALQLLRTTRLPSRECRSPAAPNRCRRIFANARVCQHRPPNFLPH